MPARQPRIGQFVSLRGRLWLVEGEPVASHDGHLLACVDDDASGEAARVLWDAEIDAALRDEESWDALSQGRGDGPEAFAAYLRTVRWRTATAAERDLFQAPFRAGIRLDPYQLLPLRKALRLPRVNLLIADDVGLPNPKIMAVTWGKLTGQHSFVEQIVREGIRAAAELDRLMRAEAEIAPYSVQAGRHREATTAKRRAHLVADAVLESFFAGSNARERERGLAEVQQLVLAPSPASWGRLEGLRERLQGSPIGITSFHWELEFNDVFARPNPGFDAIVGNPPFAGKNTIASGHPLAYPDWLKTLHPGAHGNADLAAHFFRRAYGLLRKGGAMGLIATNTIRQGDTRETGLRRIVEDGGVIFRAVSRHRWEGEAAVVVAQVFVRKAGGDALPGPAILDGRPVRRISAYLVEGDLDGSPVRLRANEGKSFAGYEIYGMGFTFDDDNAAKGKATPLAEMRRLIITNTGNLAVIKPYLGGEEVNNSPTQAHRRYTIDFSDFPLEREGEKSWASLTRAMQADQLKRGSVAFDYPHAVAADWPELLDIVRTLVLPEREKQDRARRAELWWQFGEVAPNLRKSLHLLAGRQCIVTNRGASPHLSFVKVPADICLAKTLAVFTFSSDAAFATLQSRVHEVWARFFASTLEDRLRYTPSDCFETFPLPPGHADAPALEAVGQAYHDHRAALMIARDEGMTPTYNRFHRRTDEAGDIAELRRLHHALDDAVLRAYGWDDLADAAAPVFLDEGGEDDHQYLGRLFWPAPFRDALLTRLLRLNEQRAMAESGL